MSKNRKSFVTRRVGWVGDVWIGMRDLLQPSPFVSPKRPKQPFRQACTGVLAAFLVSASWGCEGVLGEGPESESLEGTEPAGANLGIASSTRFRRLTHQQWENTVSDLLELDAPSGLSSKFRADPKQSGYLFQGNGDALEVDPVLWGAYQRAAAELAEAVTSDSERLQALLPSGADALGGEERARAFVEDFGLRAHRRPLTDREVESYLEVYRTGTSAYDDLSGFQAGVRLVIEAMLQSPHFLYLVESSYVPGTLVAPLDGFERASRLSYFLQGTMPDEELLEAAATGALDDVSGVREQARRLLDAGGARDVFLQFFEAVLDVERYENIDPQSSVFPEVSDDLAHSAALETRLFVENELFEAQGTLRDLLTSRYTYVDDVLAPLYGDDADVRGTEDDQGFARAALTEDKRSGVLTQIGFLASHATSRDPDPIHRGVFVAKRLSCLTKSAPPDNVPPLPDPDGKSNRQLVEAHTEAKGTTCPACHTTWINPFGFPFEHYDAVGAYRTMDGEHRVDASAEAPIDGVKVEVADAVELSEQLAESEQYHECMAAHLLSFALGRVETRDDKEVIATLAELSRAENVPFETLMVELAAHRVFLNRVDEE